MSYKKVIDYLISNNLLQCYRCERTLSLDRIEKIETVIWETTIHYSCPCGNEQGWRTDSGIVEEIPADKKPASGLFFDGISVGEEDRDLPFPIIVDGKKNKEETLCYFCNTPLDDESIYGVKIKHDDDVTVVDSCRECHRHRSFYCCHCGDRFSIIDFDSFPHDGSSVCEDCVNDLCRCDDCGEYYHDDEMANSRQCLGCEDRELSEQGDEEERREPPERDLLPGVTFRDDIDLIIKDKESEI